MHIENLFRRVLIKAYGKEMGIVIAHDFHNVEFWNLVVAERRTTSADARKKAAEERALSERERAKRAVLQHVTSPKDLEAIFKRYSL
jgi:hypothetical protein